MDVHDFREIVEADSFHPFVIKTKAGKVHSIKHRSDIWLPEAYESTAVLAIRGKGVMLLDIKAIEELQFEHDVAAFN
jgi:hypothetical protein